MSAGLSGLQPWLRPYAAYLLQLGAPYGVVLTSTYRSYSEQLQLWLTRSRNQYPVAPPGHSWHQYGRAFDITGPEWIYPQLGDIWRRMGGTWGGTIGDPIHFQA